MIKNNKLSRYSSNIDLVILWVDPSDPIWRKQRESYSNLSGDKSEIRFRDFDNLKYLFWGIEKFAPWVNKVFFITGGHLPYWLDKNNEKLRIVKHEEFIPKKYLPTFNSNVIEMNLHNIEDLSEKFVLLNDDIFILRKLKKSDFFSGDLPNDMYIEYTKKNPSKRYIMMRDNNLDIVNRHFNKKKFVKSNYKKIVNIKYGISNMIRNLINTRKENFLELYSDHLSKSFLKSTFFNVWNQEEDVLDRACHNRFRADTDVGQMICRYFQLLTGQFAPSKSLGKYFEAKDLKNVTKAIRNKKYKIICINDTTSDIDFEFVKEKINSEFEKAFNKKSSFER